MNNWKIIYRTTTPQEIYGARNYLESEGIVTVLKDELTAQVNNFYSNAIDGVKLMVHENDYDMALELLKTGGYVRHNHLQEENIEFVRTKERTHCPFCGSVHFNKIKEPDVIMLVIYFMLGVLFPIFKPAYRCWDCGKAWKFGKP